jgi:hypothetical protein
VDIIERTNDSLTAKIFLNINLSIEEDPKVVTAKYTFFPETEIRYEVIGGPGQGIIKNSIIIKGPKGVSADYKSAVEVNHIPLNLMCYPPPFIRDGKNYKDYIYFPRHENVYEDTMTYLMEQDLMPLEKKTTRFKVGDLCNKCKEGHLQMTGEIYYPKTVFLRCDTCGSDFGNYRIDDSDTVHVKQVD